MGPRKCCVPDCLSPDLIACHTIPPAEPLRTAWIKALSAGPKGAVNCVEGDVVCAMHFRPSDFIYVITTELVATKKLASNAVPSVFPWSGSWVVKLDSKLPSNVSIPLPSPSPEYARAGLHDKGDPVQPLGHTECLSFPSGSGAAQADISGRQYCSECDFSSVSPARLMEHVKKAHPDLAASASSDITPHLSPSSSCSSTFTRIIQKQKQNRCTVCSYRTSNATKFESHLKQHEKAGTHSCPHCSFSTDESHHLKTHLKRDHPKAKVPAVQRYTVEEPEEPIAGPSGFRGKKLKSRKRTRQIRSSSESSDDGTELVLRLVYHCPLCSFWARSVMKFEEHILAHSNSPVYQCSNCNFRERYRSHIKDHIAQKIREEDSEHEDAVCILIQPNPKDRNACYLKHSKVPVDAWDGHFPQNPSGAEEKLIFVEESGSAPVEREVRPVYRCPYCRYWARDVRNFHLHLLSHNKKKRQVPKHQYESRLQNVLIPVSAVSGYVPSSEDDKATSDSAMTDASVESCYDDSDEEWAPSTGQSDATELLSYYSPTTSSDDSSGSESDDELMTSTAPSDVTEPLSVPSSPDQSSLSPAEDSADEEETLEPARKKSRKTSPRREKSTGSHSTKSGSKKTAKSSSHKARVESSAKDIPRPKEKQVSERNKESIFTAEKGNSSAKKHSGGHRKKSRSKGEVAKHSSKGGHKSSEKVKGSKREEASKAPQQSHGSRIIAAHESSPVVATTSEPDISVPSTSRQSDVELDSEISANTAKASSKNDDNAVSSAAVRSQSPQSKSVCQNGSSSPGNHERTSITSPPQSPPREESVENPTFLPTLEEARDNLRMVDSIQEVDLRNQKHACETKISALKKEINEGYKQLAKMKNDQALRKKTLEEKRESLRDAEYQLHMSTENEAQLRSGKELLTARARDLANKRCKTELDYRTVQRDVLQLELTVLKSSGSRADHLEVLKNRERELGAELSSVKTMLSDVLEEEKQAFAIWKEAQKQVTVSAQLLDIVRAELAEMEAIPPPPAPPVDHLVAEMKKKIHTFIAEQEEFARLSLLLAVKVVRNAGQKWLDAVEVIAANIRSADPSVHSAHPVNGISNNAH